MAKNRNKKNKAKKGAGGVAAMDTSEGGPVASTTASAPQPMDTSEGNQPSSTSMALGSINKLCGNHINNICHCCWGNVRSLFCAS
uniref:Uncharacterized protein n=1 Tax=Setaria italica TaxID=4555 RepID=K3ZYK5_SETIT